MKQIITILTIAIISCTSVFSANFYWVSNSASNWNNPANWSNTSGGSGGAGVPGSADFVYFSSNGTGNCTVDISVTVEGISINGYTGIIDLNGNPFLINGASNCTFADGTINDTPGSTNLTITTTGSTNFSGTTFNTPLNVSAGRILLNGSTFNADCSFTKTGNNNDYSSGGNTFNGNVTLTNAGSGNMILNNTNPDIYNGNFTVTNSSANNLIYLSHTAAGTQYKGNIILNNTTGNGIRFGQNNGTCSLASGMTISIGSGGFATGTLRLRGFTQLGNTTQTITLTGSAILYLEQNSIWDGPVNITSPRIFIRENIFNNTLSATKTGSNDDYMYGGNTFNGATTLSNSSTNAFGFGNTAADVFNNDVTLILSGTNGDIQLARSSTGNQFNGNININYISPDDVYIGRNSGTSTLASGQTINIIGFGSSGTGNLYLEEFTQLGNTPQFISLNTNGRLEIGPNTTFNGNLTASVPNLYFFNSTFNGDVNFNKTGSSTNSSSGGNTFNGITTIENSGSGELRLATTTADVFNNEVTFSSTGSNRISAAYTGSTFNNNIYVNSTNSSTGVHINNSTNGTSTLAAGYTITVGSLGFNSGNLYLRNFTQIGNTPQSLTLTGTADLDIHDCNWGGDVNFIAPSIITRGTIYNRTAYLEKTGSGNDYSVGGNTFTMDLTAVNSGSNAFIFGNGTLDTFGANVTLNNTGSGNMHLAYNGSGHSIAGNLTINNTPTPTNNGTVIIGNNNSVTLSIGGNVSITNNGSGSGADVYTYFCSRGAFTVNGNLSIVNSSSANNSRVYCAYNTGSTLTINGTTTVINNGSSSNDDRVYLGVNGSITFNNTLTISNQSGSPNSHVYLNNNTNSTNLYNENIIVESTNSNCDGVLFGASGGSGTLAATKTITIGSGGFIAGDLYFRNFTQTGNTPHSFTLTGTSRFYNYDSNWGGDFSAIAPNLITRGTVYNRTAYLEKTGSGNDYSAGGNSFTMDLTAVNSGSNAFIFGNGTFDTFSANVTFNNTGSGDMYLAYSGSGHSVTGNLTVNNQPTAGNGYVYISSGSTATLSIGGDVSVLNSGAADNIRTIIANSGILTINGNLSVTNNGSSINSQVYIANGTSSNVTVNGVTTILNNGNSSSYNEIYIGQSGDVTFNNTLSITNSSASPYSYVYLNRYANSSNIYNGNIIVECTNANNDGIRFGTSSGQGTLSSGYTISVGSNGFITGRLSFRNFIQQGATPQTLTLTGTATLYFEDGSIFNGDLTTVSPSLYLNGTTFNGVSNFTKNANTNDDSRGGNRFNNTTTITNNSSSRLRLSNNTNYPDTFYADVNFINLSGGTMEVAYNNNNIFTGNININNSSTLTFGRGNGVALFTGANAQSINDLGSSPNANFYRMEINKTSNNVTLNMPADVVRTLTLNNGNLITTSTNILTMYDNATVGAVSNASYVDGPMIKRGNDAFTFPVGNNGFYAPISISAPSSNSAEFLAQYFNIDPNSAGYNTTLKDLSLNHVSICEYWILNRVASTNNVDVTLSWDSRSCGVTNLSELAVARWDGSMWRDHGNGGVTGTTSSGTVVTSAPVTNFSPFTLASVTANNPLPVELISFEAVLNNQKVDLKWVTATEINNDYFVVEKSKDGKNWEEVVWTDGAGNSNYTLEYYEVDEKPYEGVSYYRLKQVDFNGKYTYSSVVPVNNEINTVKDISILPNPVNNGEPFYIEVKGFENEKCLISITNMQGKAIYTTHKTINNNNELIAIKLNDNIPSGTYLIIVSSNNGQITKRLVIK
jgi:hypothetical protein